MSITCQTFHKNIISRESSVRNTRLSEINFITINNFCGSKPSHNISKHYFVAKGDLEALSKASTPKLSQLQRVTITNNRYDNSVFSSEIGVTVPESPDRNETVKFQTKDPVTYKNINSAKSYYVDDELSYPLISLYGNNGSLDTRTGLCLN